MVNGVVLNYISNLIKTTWLALLVSPFRQIAMIFDEKSNVKLLKFWTLFNCSELKC